jgi:hypothetical protein
MLHYIIGFLGAVLLLCACSQHKADTEQATTFYATIYASFHLYNDQQQQFIDTLTKDINTIKRYPDAKINTVQLYDLLDSAQDANDQRAAMIKDLQEVDPEIGLKNKEMQYIAVFNSAYKKEFKEVIDMIASNAPGRFKRFCNLAVPKLKEIKKAEVAYTDANAAFRDKYGLSDN